MEINGHQAFKFDESSLVCFWETTAKNEYASKQEGRPIFDVVLMGQIRTPGAKMSIFDFEIERRCHGGQVKRRVNERSELWVDVLENQLAVWRKQREDKDLSGTPLETWPKLGVAEVASLNASGIYSMEQLAALPDSRLDVLGMNGRVLREQAKAHIELAKKNAPMEKLVEENETLKGQMESLRLQIQELSDKYVSQEEKRGPGRPRKEIAA